jgi:hypothetical protein
MHHHQRRLSDDKGPTALRDFPGDTRRRLHNNGGVIGRGPAWTGNGWASCLRGAQGLALALSLPAALPLRDEIVVVTFAVVAFSIVVQGLTMPWLLRRLGFLPLDPASG